MFQLSKFIIRISVVKYISYPVLIFLFTRVFLILILQSGFTFLTLPFSQNYYDLFPNKIFLNGLLQWDSGWYAITASEGYSLTKYPLHNNLTFMPMYPILIRFLISMGINVFVAGIIISNISLLLATIIIYRFITNLFSKDIANKTIILLLLNPFSIFFSAMYTESLFLLFTVVTFYNFFKKRWFITSIFASLAGLTHIIGLIVPIICLLSFLIINKFKLTKLYKSMLLLLIGFLGPVLYLIFIQIKFGSFWLIFQSQQNFGGLFYKRLAYVYQVINFMIFNNVLVHLPNLFIIFLHLFLGFLSIYLILKTWKKLPIYLSLWALFALIISFADPPCLGRHIITFFPVFISFVLLIQNHKNLYRFTLGISIVLFILISLLFSHGYFVA